MPILRKPAQYGFFSFDGGLLHQLSDAYGLGPLTGFRPILLDGDRCTLIDVRSQTSRKMVIEGSDGTRLFLKQIPWYCERDTLLLATRWQTQARAAGAPVPRLLHTRAGAPWFEIAGSYFTLTEYVPGHRYTGTADDRAQAGAAIARLHATTVDAPSAPAENAFAGALAHIALTRESTAVSHTVLDAMERAVHTWAEQADASGWDTLAGQLTHGDTNPWNLIYTDAGAMLIDFDNAHRGPSLRDIAEALLSFCSVHYQQDSTTFAPVLPGPIDRAAAADLLGAYARVRRPSPVEAACIPPAGGAVAVGLVCLGLLRGDYPAAMAPDLAAWATAVPGDITEILPRDRP
ncbi:phosphotransferase [Streptomyces sp. AV19]|uniref:phosphotransferase enzyme family protein n=1 Tax=Streptomyces sp. AV19 TaxID=2793068 RepID=UPI0018FE0778|nr:phosphotransferase [Streptomyces sp. AV19]MBH1937793.1 phosphotransferase [Streptomyces sp. AV19]MDG4537069.1 phosphotransferase [Streptomyces sp. AV19]